MNSSTLNHELQQFRILQTLRSAPLFVPLKVQKLGCNRVYSGEIAFTSNRYGFTVILIYLFGRAKLQSLKNTVSKQ